MKYNLKPRKSSRKDYSAHKTHLLGTTPFQDELLFLSPVLNQGDVNDCTAVASVATRDSEVSNVTFDPIIFWNDELAFNGVTSSPDGFDLKTPAAVGVKTGFALTGTTVHQSQASAYLWITAGGGQDLFDNIRSIIQQFQRPVMAGMLWYTEYVTPTGILADNGVTLNGGHCIKIAGWTTKNGVPYLVIQNSWGTEVGDQGLFYIPRELVNKAFSQFGVFYWSDDPTLKIKKMGLLQALLQNLVNLYQALINQNAGYPPPVPHPLINALAQGIFEAEGGGKQGGMKYNNPGDIRGLVGNEYIAGLGATGYGMNNLAIFPTLAIGQQATVQLCTDVANNLLLSYPKPCTIQEFVKVYGDPQTQAEWDNYVIILLSHIGNAKVASDTLTSLL